MNRTSKIGFPFYDIDAYILVQCKLSKLNLEPPWDKTLNSTIGLHSKKV